MALLFEMDPMMFFTDGGACGGAPFCRRQRSCRRGQWSDEGWDFLQARFAQQREQDPQVSFDALKNCFAGLSQRMAGCQDRAENPVSVFDVLQDGFARLAQQSDTKEGNDITGCDILQDGFVRLVNELSKAQKPKENPEPTGEDGATGSTPPESDKGAESILNILQDGVCRLAQEMSKSRDPKESREHVSKDDQAGSNPGECPVSFLDVLEDGAARLAQTMSHVEGSKGCPETDLKDDLARGIPQDANKRHVSFLDIVQEGAAKLSQEMSKPRDLNGSSKSFADVLQDSLSGLAEGLDKSQDPGVIPAQGLHLLQSGLSQIVRDLVKPQDSAAFDMAQAGPSGPSQQKSKVESPNEGMVSVQVEQNKARDLGLSLDARGFSPEEIRVKLKDRTVTIEARHEEGQKDSGSYVLKELKKQFTLPEDVEIDSLACEMTPEGLLYLKASVKSAKNAKETVAMNIETAKDNVTERTEVKRPSDDLD